MPRPARPLPVVVPLSTSMRKPSRLVLVLDPDQDNPVRVWWHLDRPGGRWRCSVHGPRRRATCEHMTAAYPALRDVILGSPP